MFFAQVEGRLLPMLENHSELTLLFLNEATQAWVELEYQRALHRETGETPLKRFLHSPSVGRDCPPADELRLAFCTETSRLQRLSDGTISIDGIRFELPSRFRHLRRVSVRYASWDLGHVYLVDEHTAKLLARLYPVDKTKNAEGLRKSLEIQPASAERPASTKHAVAPLLRQLIDQYRQTGLPPAYLPKTTKEDS